MGIIVIPTSKSCLEDQVGKTDSVYPTGLLQWVSPREGQRELPGAQDRPKKVRCHVGGPAWGDWSQASSVLECVAQG